MTVALGTSVACTWSVAEASAAWTASTVPMRTRVASAGCCFRRNRSVRGFVPSSAAATALVKHLPPVTGPWAPTSSGAGSSNRLA